jgi:hypothetical protein
VNAPDHTWCWQCGEQRTRSGSYVHRADNPVLAHDRCAVCNDVLMPYPQPTLGEKLATLGEHLHEAYRAARTVTTTDPDSDAQAALDEITELLTQARRVYFRRLDRRLNPDWRRTPAARPLMPVTELAAIAERDQREEKGN